MPDLVIRHMRQGAGVKELAHYLGVSRNTIYNWVDPKHKQYHRPFAQAIELGRELSEAWWLRWGRLAMMRKVPSGPTAYWIFNMKNRFGWRDRVELAGSEDAPLIIEQKLYLMEHETELPALPAPDGEV